MTKYYFLVAFIFCTWFGHCQDCTTENLLDSPDRWSGSGERFRITSAGWELQDSIARESTITYRFDSLVNAIRTGFSLLFPPSTANQLELSLGLENADMTTTGRLVLRVGQSGDRDGVQFMLEVGTEMTEAESIWEGVYGNGVVQASWLIEIRADGISIRNGLNEPYHFNWDANKGYHLQIRSISLTCRYTRTRAAAFAFHHLYAQNSEQQTFMEIQPGELFFSEYYLADDAQDLYIELFNIIDESICVSGLSISIDGLLIPLPSISLHPGMFVVLMDSTSRESPTPQSLQIQVSFPFEKLSDPVEIKLFQLGRLLHGVLASPAMPKPMEMVDISQPCRRDNWKSSRVEAGTRGTENSWFSTLSAPKVTFKWETARTGMISFPFVCAGGSFPEGLIEINFPFQWIHMDIWGNGTFQLISDIPVGDSLQITISGEHMVCSGMAYQWDTMIVATPGWPGEKGNLRITEIMYEPRQGCPEYLEITNLTDRSTWWETVGIQKNESEKIELPVQWQWPLQESRIFTTSLKDFMDCYPEARNDLVIETDFFVLNNSGAELSVWSGSKWDRLIDRARYHPSDHHPSFRQTAGIALERDIYELPGNKWRSGFVQLGYRSPGFLPEWDENTESLVEFSATTIYTRDGREPSVLEIGIGGDVTDGNITIEIFDLNGLKVSTLTDAVPMQGGEIITWDGTSSTGARLPEGLYLFWIYFFDVTGHQKTIKKTCVLSNN